MRLTMFGLLALALGCSSATLPEIPNSDVDVSLAWLQQVDVGPIARITVTNRSESTLAVTCNGFWVERQTIEGWELARSPACAGNPRVPLEPGASITIDLEVNSAATYRATVHVTLPDGSRSTTFHTDGSMP